MAFRLAVIAAGSCASAQEAKNLVTVMRTAPRGRTPAAFVEVLGALESSGVGEFTVGRRSDSRGALLSVPHPEDGVLEALLLLARDHDVAVYDIRLNRLYDPTGGIDVEVLLPGVPIPFLTRDLLADLVLRPEWPLPDAPYIIVHRSAQDFIQVWRDEGTYRLEYREGGAEFHYLCLTDDPDVAIDVMWAWATGDPSWRGALAWEFLELPEPRSVQLQNERWDDGSRLNLDATLDTDGELQISGHDLGPVASGFGGEYEWWYTVDADDVPRLVVALGGKPGGDIIELLVENYSGYGGYRLGPALRKSEVPYRFTSWP